MNRRDLLRSSLLVAGMGAIDRSAYARIFPFGYDPQAKLEAADWKPVFLNAHQNETLIVLSDAVIPATDTPGAKAALVNRFLDLVMSVEVPETQQQFLSSLTWLDTGSQSRYKSNFASLTAEELDDFLGLIAWPHTDRLKNPSIHFIGHEHFLYLKDWISRAYYSSPIGLKELGWDGSAAHGEFSGCGHSLEEHSEA